MQHRQMFDAPTRDALGFTRECSCGERFHGATAGDADELFTRHAATRLCRCGRPAIVTTAHGGRCLGCLPAATNADPPPALVGPGFDVVAF